MPRFDWADGSLKGFADVRVQTGRGFVATANWSVVGQSIPEATSGKLANHGVVSDFVDGRAGAEPLPSIGGSRG